MKKIVKKEPKNALFLGKKLKIGTFFKSIFHYKPNKNLSLKFYIVIKNK